MYKIGELSRLCKIPVKTLRYYDKEGLLPPDRVDAFTGYRYYGAEKLAQCYRILAMKALGFSLQEIKEQLLTSDERGLLTAIRTKQGELLLRQKQTEQQLKRLQELESLLSEEGSGGEITMFDIVIQRQEKIRAAFSREIFTSRQQAFRRLEEMKEELSAHMATGRALFIDYTMEYVEDALDAAVCVEISDEAAVGNIAYPVKSFTLEGNIAVLACRKEELEKAYREMMAYLENHLFQVVGPCYQFLYPDGMAEIKIPVWELQEKGELRNDDIQLPFENDPEVIGRWRFLDCVPSRECFHEKAPHSTEKSMIKELYFLPEGQWYWCFGWTKGYLLSRMDYPSRLAKNRYTVEHLDGKTFLFVEMKGYYYHFHQGKPEIWVFERVDGNAHTMAEIRIKDNIDMPFVPDERVLGDWKACDFVEEMENFDPQSPHMAEEMLYWRETVFSPEGRCRKVFRDGSIYEAPNCTWTKDYVLGHTWETAERYVLQSLEGKDYLFIQWKTGDYVYDGRAPWYYVFERS